MIHVSVVHAENPKDDRFLKNGISGVLKSREYNRHERWIPPKAVPCLGGKDEVYGIVNRDSEMIDILVVSSLQEMDKPEKDQCCLRGTAVSKGDISSVRKR